MKKQRARKIKDEFNEEKTKINSWKKQGALYSEKNRLQPVKVYTPEEIEAYKQRNNK